jgi:hypothetical protein
LRFGLGKSALAYNAISAVIEALPDSR